MCIGNSKATTKRSARRCIVDMLREERGRSRDRGAGQLHGGSWSSEMSISRGSGPGPAGWGVLTVSFLLYRVESHPTVLSKGKQNLRVCQF